MKLLLYILTFFSILGCKSSRQEQNNDLRLEVSEAKCIERIFKKDSILGEIRNHASEKISLSQAIMDYTAELESLDYSDCPGDFVSLFRRHITAWKMVTKITNNYPSQRGELHEIFLKIEKSQDSTEFRFLVKQVRDTWNEVEKSIE